MNQDLPLQDLLQHAGITQLNEMQEDALRSIPQQANTLLLSPTGSGKTLAFMLPLLTFLQKDKEGIQCLIIVPTRELGLQLEQVWKQLSTGYKVNFCYGGHAIETEMNNLKHPPTVLIGTPGRLCDHLLRGSFDPKPIHTLILDEFDKSLELGFQDQMDYLIRQLPQLSHRILVSATSDLEIPKFTGATDLLRLDYIQESTNTKLRIFRVISPEKDKIDTLFDLLCQLNSEAALIFCNHREVAERISQLLNEKEIMTSYYHGGMDQDERERALIQFRNGSIDYLVTTDLAARGLDIPAMNHVIHYHLPTKQDEFTHRNGRTARMEAEGTAYVVLHKEDKLPAYLPKDLPLFVRSHESRLPDRPAFHTLYISGGKKNKLSKTDIVGFFTKTGGLPKEAIGRIEVKDFASFVAVKNDFIRPLLTQIQQQKIKGKKYKIEVARPVIKREKRA
jgi:ATP-dependent RNA helicase DeaD